MAKQRKSSVGAINSAPAAGDAGIDATARLKPKRSRKRVQRECPSQRTSVYRGVTRHRWTGRFEAHLWDKNTWSEPQRKKKGRQVYLGELSLYLSLTISSISPLLSNYDKEWKEMEEQSREEYIGSLRRKSTGFSRGVSKYRGVARHHHNGKWEARIGRVFGNKYLYLATQEEAAMAYDIAAIEHRGLNAVTNFDVSSYIKWHHLCRAGDVEGLHGPGQLPVDMAPHPTVDLDEAMALAALHKHEDGQLLPPHVSPPSHAALGLLLQSPGFKEMIERSVASEGSTRSPSSSSSSPSPPPPPALTQQQQQEPEYSGGPSSARCSFPDDVQTYFGCEDHDGGVGYGEVDTFLFGDLGAYASSMFQFELDV
ncbi:hypothetical protein ACQ4PT_007275 [Festuca glaucescens]